MSSPTPVSSLIPHSLLFLFVPSFIMYLPIVLFVCLFRFDYDVITAPYQRKVIEKIKKNHPTVPTIMYINKVVAR